MDYVTLNDGMMMPQLGLGVYQIDDQNVTKQTVMDGLKNGYRLIDTASAYFNEEGVGEGIKASGVARKDIFLTSKLWWQDYAYEDAKKGIDTSLEKLGTDYLDLYLLHQPVGDIFGAWRALEEAQKAGKIRSIGVSNMNSGRLTDLIANSSVVPSINQVEIHPFFQEKDQVEYMKSQNVTPEAWGPLAQGAHDIFNNSILKEIGEKYNKSVAQVVLRWLLQRGVVVIPKSTHEQRLIQNIDVFDFKLSDDDMNKIATLDLNKGVADYSDPDFVNMLLKLRVRN
ncbi:aldo/keto reductase [Companilactobacillus ginsenosidimutans]|uniref:2,5-diketo-D-gluconic acid reductase n=1 Tax=Companilactobacillus ginsenosidimutans TaxID=1007676 RepID=A0A0H4QJX7_9LACO|nr:aldo/keto reductase [Companilactobacillus ginsenosidimutans]AKP67366.1 2,5-diketo-D-gluconic acid reductase [Companilactobacillus ginsenosidimutans]